MLRNMTVRSMEELWRCRSTGSGFESLQDILFFDKRIPLKHVIRADQDVKEDKIALIHLSQLIFE